MRDSRRFLLLIDMRTWLLFYPTPFSAPCKSRQITAEQYSSGSSKTKAIVETVGTVASVGASIAAIVVAYNQIKNGNDGG